MQKYRTPERSERIKPAVVRWLETGDPTELVRMNPFFAVSLYGLGEARAAYARGDMDAVEAHLRRTSAPWNFFTTDAHDV